MRSTRLLVALQIAVFTLVTAAMPAGSAVIGNADYFAGTAGQPSLGTAGQLLARDDVQARLIALGFDPADAQARVQALSPAELERLNARLDALPAGGSILGLLGAVFVVLLVLELVGVTDVFSGL
jgi:hypothetical protein